jgi:hypothetical protein
LANAGLHLQDEFWERGFYFAVELPNFDPSQTMKTRRLILTAAIALVCSSTLPAQPTTEPTIQQKLDKIIFPTVQFNAVTIDEAVEYLRVKSRDLDTSSVPPSPKGVSIVLRTNAKATGSISLDLKNIPLGVALGYCVDLAGLKYRVDAHGVMIAASFEPTPAQPAAAPPPMLGNAEAILFPTVQFQGATLDEAAEYLRIKSRELDTAKKGVNIVIKPGGAAAKISLDLRDIPLPYVLGYVAELSQHKLTTDGYSYILTPLEAK